MTNPQPDQLKQVLTEIIRENLTPEAWGWLAEKSALINHSAQQLTTSFISLPRKTGKATVHFTSEQQEQINAARPGLNIRSWTIDRLCRVWLLLHLDGSNKEHYIKSVEQLFSGAEMNELVALYSSLPLLQYPENWVFRCTEGIRSNIGFVLEAVICNNPYPAEQLPDAAWNQLVMKAFFTEKPIHTITGIDRRANRELSQILWDYANERWAAGRTVNPQLWRCVGPFIDEKIIPGIERVFNNGDAIDRQAAALACFASNHEPAKHLLNTDPGLKNEIEKGELTWNRLGEQSMVTA